MKSRKLFREISRNPFRGTRSEKFLVTHSEEILSKEFLVTNSREFLVFQFFRKTRENLWKFLRISSKKVFRTNYWNFLGTIPKIFSRVPQEYLEIFLSKFTNQDLGLIVVNNFVLISKNLVSIGSN